MPVIIAGPCVIESRDMALRHAEELAVITEQVGLPLVFKASYDKANRTSIDSFRGVGIERGLGALAEIKKQFNLPILTDVHTPAEARMAADVVDILQIPAFLCRQTDLLTAAGLTGCVVNVKKGPFVSGRQMKHVADKIRRTGNSQIILTERGTSFGHGDLVVDFRDIVEMQELGYPVVYDATHSVQQPGAGGTLSGGNRQYIEPLAAAALALHVSGLFFEVHENPDAAYSDRETQIALADFSPLLDRLLETYALDK